MELQKIKIKIYDETGKAIHKIRGDKITVAKSLKEIFNTKF